jgi:galactokinase/mevalonate kinase-like predicted kinase
VIVTSRAPVRVDFGGGWTDVDLFARGAAAGGVVLNATIDKYVTGQLARHEAGEGAGAREGLTCVTALICRPGRAWARRAR